MPTAIIIGSGLIGAATALALHKVGIHSILYDQVDLAQAIAEGNAVEFGDSGGAVAIQASGLRVLRSLGLLDECLKEGTTTPYASWAKIDGSAQVVIDTRTWNKTAGETDPVMQLPLQILRSKLHSILMRACHRAGIKAYVGKKLVDVKQDESVVTATFADGTIAMADLLIGADGIHSTTRRKVFGEKLTAKFTGEMGHIGVVNLKQHNIDLKDTERIIFYVDNENLGDEARNSNACNLVRGLSVVAIR
ncbi:FAD/NAD(P)-binding domain-containing protein [Rhizoclosmatium globosum]|uniref:FAD/NAD(P)-binding domain-containing protein n=1 Tax=Rhizoclosmatium globosum TaxID=329046 RepID=A0A1Y2BUB5_9FUNG|nr:FAD/NAD(P)-binding domain-containing protein [Rhizoclosmatium globosum]|eukprot:ORY38227.1 FAD/NAD(P)-binding domain-containing protein [Rhizoclosmatium globosum]